MTHVEIRNGAIREMKTATRELDAAIERKATADELRSAAERWRAARVMALALGIETE